jgi:endonuclease/exonuclease/phosphatase (EEP) superfamily protein YafD
MREWMLQGLLISGNSSIKVTIPIMYKTLTVILACVTVLTIFGFLGQVWWVFDLASHFRFQYFIVLVVLVIFFIKEKKWKSTGVGLFFGVANFILISPYIGIISSVTEEDQSEIRIISMNLSHTNSSYKKAKLFIRETQPSVLILQELSNSWENALGEELGQFSYSAKILENTENTMDGVGFPIPNFLIPKEKLFIGIYSHLPFEKIMVDRPDDFPISYMRGSFKFKEKVFTLFGVHLISPVGKYRTDLRNKQLASLAEEIQKNNQPTVVIGDFNITPWSPHFEKFIQKTRLRDTRKGLGFYPTWQAQFPPLAIPIDHGLTSNSIKVGSFSLGNSFGSDHLPIILDFSVG